MLRKLFDLNRVAPKLWKNLLCSNRTPQSNLQLINPSSVIASSAQQSRLFATDWTQNLYDVDDSNKQKKLKILQVKLTIMFEEGTSVPNPETIKPDEWEYMLTLRSERSLESYLSYLLKKQTLKEKHEKVKDLRAVALQDRRNKMQQEILENKHLIYGLYHNSLYLQMTTKAKSKILNRRLFRKSQFALKLVFDCSYDEEMTEFECRRIAEQLKQTFATNRKHKNPYDLHLCNVDFNAPTMQALQKKIPTVHNKSFPLNLHPECFTKIFSPERLVYLVPDCRHTVDEFNPNDIFVIGASYGRASANAMANAKKLGIRMARLPIEQYLRWGSRPNHNLPLNQICNILLDWRYTHDWNQALIHIPRRNLF